MRKLSVYLSVCLLAIAFVFSSCGGGEESSGYTSVIPKEAAIIMKLDGNQLANKAKLGEFLENPMIKMSIAALAQKDKEAHDKLQKILKDPSASGIDTKKPTYFFMLNPEKEGIFGLSMAVKNKDEVEKLVTFIAAKSKKEASIKTMGGVKYIADKEVVFGWDASKILIIGTSNYKQRSKLEEFFKTSMNLPKEKSIWSNNNFKKFANIEKDFAIWTSSEGLMNPMAKMMMGKIFGKEISMKGVYSQGYLNFEKGAVRLGSEAIYNSDFEKILKEKNPLKTKVDTKVLDALPGEGVMAAMQISLNPEIILSYMDMLGRDWKQAKKQAKKMNIDLDKLVKSFGGDVAANITGFKKMGEGTRANVIPEFTMAATLKDNSEFKKLEKQIPAKMLESKGKYTEVKVPSMSFYYGFSKGLFIFGNNEEIIKKAVNGGFGSKSLANNDCGDILKDKAFALHLGLDLDKYPQSVKDMLRHTMGRQYAQVEAVVGDYKSINMFVEGNSKFEMNVELKNDSENSLYLIMQMIMKNAGKLMM